jgi:succinate-acetate transporter protein
VFVCVFLFLCVCFFLKKIMFLNKKKSSLWLGGWGGGLSPGIVEATISLK